eukprot:3977064-Pyramimonas_sp.AAC.1
MWLSPRRCADSLQTIAIVSRNEGGAVSKCGSRPNAAHTLLKHVQEFHGLMAAPFQNVPMVTVPEIMFWSGSGLPRRYNYVNSQCSSPKDGVLARIKVVKAQQST